jgi:hypothetical protein
MTINPFGEVEDDEDNELGGAGGLHLIYVSEAGEHNDDVIYEFFFSDRPDDAIGENWEDVCLYNVKPPQEEFCTKIGVLKTSAMQFSLLEEQEQFRYLEGVFGVIALAWEYVEDFNALPSLEYSMLSFFYGAPLEEVVTKLKGRNLELEWKD